MSTDLITTMGQDVGMSREVYWDTLRSTVIPREASDAEVMAFLTVAKEYGLNPFIKEISAFKGKNGGIIPVVTIDGWSGIVNKQNQLDGIEFECPPHGDWLKIDESAKYCPQWMTVRIYRKDLSHPISITEYLDEVYQGPKNRRDGGGKFDGPWQTHTKRMLRHKTLIQGARIAFSISGIYDPDEASRIADGANPDQMFHPADAEMVPENLQDRASQLASEINEESPVDVGTEFKKEKGVVCGHPDCIKRLVATCPACQSAFCMDHWGDDDRCARCDSVEDADIEGESTDGGE